MLPVHHKAAAVDDVHLAGELRRHPQFLAVRRRREPARPRTDNHVARDRAAVGIDRVHEVAGLGGDVDGVAVIADQHALRLGPGRHLPDDDVTIHVDDRERRALFGRNINAASLPVDAERLGDWARS